jgi:hypothetical protein
MTIETVVRRRVKRLKEGFPGMDERQLERELIPLSGEEIQPRLIKKKMKQ